MSRFVLRGGKRLSGELTAQGAKNSVLPILAATILSRGVCVLHRCPRLRDVEVSLEILRYIGASAEREGDSLRVDASGVCRCAVPDDTAILAVNNALRMRAQEQIDAGGWVY